MRKETIERARENPVHEMGDLSIDQDLGHHRRRWLFQRVGSVGMALFLLAGLCGFFGKGPLSDRSLSAPDSSCRIEYRRFEHREAATGLRLTLGPHAAANEGSVSVAISRAYLDRIQLSQVTPRPDSVEIGSEFSIYRFRRGPGVGDGTITFDYEIEKIGPLEGRIGIEGHPTVAFSQFVYP